MLFTGWDADQLQAGLPLVYEPHLVTKPSCHHNIYYNDSAILVTQFTYLAEENLHVPRILSLLQAQIHKISRSHLTILMSYVSWIAMQPFPDYSKVLTFYTITQKVAESCFEIINN